MLMLPLLVAAIICAPVNYRIVHLVITIFQKIDYDNLNIYSDPSMHGRVFAILAMQCFLSRQDKSEKNDFTDGTTSLA